jgi:hypothetical protein
MNDDATPAKVRLTDNLGGWEPPQGWTVESPDGLPDCVLIGCPGLGWVTVDMKGRFFGLGIGRPNRWSGLRNSPGFTGKGWQRRIMEAAEQYLRTCSRPFNDRNDDEQ